MKKQAKKNVIPFRPAYPYAKDARYYLDKIVDWTLAGITSVGAIMALAFMFLL